MGGEGTRIRARDPDAACEGAPLSQPILEIGQATGDPHSELFGVRDGWWNGTRVVLLNAGTAEVRFYNRNGELARSVGGRGEGPGEFRQPSWMGRFRGDSIAVFDWDTARMSILDERGKFGRSFVLQPQGARRSLTVAGVVADSLFVLLERAVHTPGGVSGIVMDSLTIQLWTPNGHLGESVGRYPDSEVVREATGSSVWVTARPFGTQSRVLVRDERIYVAMNRPGDVVQVFPAGGETGRMYVRRDRREITDEEIQSYVDYRVSSLESRNARLRLRARLEAIVYPAEHAAFTAVALGPDAEFWIRAASVDLDAVELPVAWSRLGRRDVESCALIVPGTFRILDVERGSILGVYRGALDEERVALYRID